jgi:FMN-dependent oxidoreductase (nitrilotriacetate monooxygenase family)
MDEMHLGLEVYHLTHGFPVGSWRFPNADVTSTTFDFYQRVARLLELGKFDYMFIGDGLSVPDFHAQSFEMAVRTGTFGVFRHDPTIVLANVAAVTEHLGLAATLSTTYNTPYDLARKFSSLDHISGGRAAWNVVTSRSDSDARNFGIPSHLEHDTRYDRADEFVEITMKLWDSWADDALVLDKAKGVFADPSKVQYIDHHGQWFDVRGPLTLPRPPQGYPVVIQAGSSDRGKDSAARWADVVFTGQHDVSAAAAFGADVRRRAEEYGRSGDELKILVACVVVMDETPELAREKNDFLDSLVQPDAVLSRVSWDTNYDLSAFGPDDVIPDMQINGAQTGFSRIKGKTLATVAKTGGRGGMRFVGTPVQIADKMEEWFSMGGSDGFMLEFVYPSIEQFVISVVPELQRRGLFRTEYPGKTLREVMGLPRPPQGDWLRRHHPDSAGQMVEEAVV